MDILIEQVKSVFSNDVTDESFSQILNELVENVNNIEAADLNFNPDKLELFNCEDAKERYPAATSIEIMENETFTMNMFILQKDSRIPLHDHPDMHGIIKVIHGTVKITSYTQMSCDRNEIDIPEDIENVVGSCKLNSLIPVELKMSENVTVNHPPCLVTPTDGNYHEIQAVEGLAVIFDILAPPYGDRECNFYSVLETNVLDVQCKIWLSKEREEPSFWV